jgi:hypothetical protein
MKPYESDVTKFMRDFLERHPEVVEKQKQARATWWDRPQSLNVNKALDAAKVPKKSYEYYDLEKDKDA